MLNDDLPPEEIPLIPEPYEEYLDMKALGFNKWWPGEYAAQPYIWLREREACMRGERQFRKIQEFNREMRAKYNGQQQAGKIPEQAL